MNSSPLFPLDAMPESLKTLAVHVASQHGSPPGVAVLAILSALGAAVGPTVNFMPRPGQKFPALLNVVFSTTKSSTQSLVEDAFDPLVMNNSFRCRGLMGQTRQWLEQEVACFLRKRAQHLAQLSPDRQSEPTPFDTRLANLWLARRPIVALETKYDDIWDLVGASDCQTFLLTYPHQASEHMRNWAKPSARKKQSAARRFRAPSLAPTKSDVVVAPQSEVQRFLGSGPRATNLAGVLLFVSDYEEPVPPHAAPPAYWRSKFPERWGPWLRRLFDSQLTDKPSVVEPTPEALEILDEAIRTTQDVLSELPAERACVSNLWPQQVQRLALSMHLACESTGHLSSEIARATWALAQWLAVQQLMAGLPHRVANPGGDEDTSCCRNSFAATL
ncbi:MAG TPA: hypothetical protein VN708_26545 [Terriglobales bacterium]|nr:hypothetical protein [Terriglobales bacterium]